MKAFFTISLIITFCASLTTVSFAQRKNKEVGETLEGELSPYERANAEYLLIEAQKFFLLEDYKRALAFLDQSLEVDEKNHAAYFKKAEVHLVLEEYEKGLSAIDQAIELASNNKYYYVLAAQIHKANNDLTAAARYYDLMLNHSEDYGVYLEEITRVYEELNQLDKALTVLTNAENASGLTLNQKSRKVDLLIKAKKNEDAITYLEALHNQNPDNSQILYQYAFMLSSVNRSDRAIEVLESSILKTNDLKLLLAENYQKAGRGEDQKKLLLEVYNDPDSNLSIKTLLLGQWAFSGDITDNALMVDSLQTALEADYPEDPIALESGALLYSKLAQGVKGDDKKRFEDKAILRYRELTRLKPGDFNIWSKVLSYRYEERQWQQLSASAEEALDLFPNQVTFYLYLASAKIGLKELDEAESLLKQASRMYGSNQDLKSQVLGKQAELEVAKGNANEAVTLFEQALEAGTPKPETVGAFAELLTSTDPQKALRLIDLVISSPFKNLGFIRIKALALFNLSDYTGAHEIIAAGITEFPGQLDGAILELNGDILFKLNKVDAAVEQWKTAKSIGGTSDKIDQKIENKQYN